jgi:carboxypeptidase C (cathepsin A)
MEAFMEVKDLFNGLYQGKIFSGYLKTTIEGDELFYIYMPAQTGEDTAPIMLWLNGGPGCSSLFGLLGEVGPVTEDNFAYQFKLNPYSWNKEVNLLAIEQPAGVGFSKAHDPEFKWDDDKMGENLLAGIKDFLNTHNLNGREFFVSGESYAGVYIPTLAKYIVNDKSDVKVNLKGILIGNGLTNFETDVERSMVEFGFWHGMISQETFNLFKKHCPHKSDELHPEEESSELNDGFYPRNVTHRCNEIREEIRNNLDGSDIYGIYRLCPKGNQITPNNPLFYNSKNTYRKTILEKLKKKDKYLKDLEPEDDVWPNGCNDDLFFDIFLNNETIKTKLAVDTSIIWTQCWGGLNYDMGESFKFYSETMLKFPDLKVWVFSGTEDGVLSTLGTMRWINKLNFTIENEWTQYKVNEQVAGFAQKYKEGLVIVTVKGAGHMVPQDQRASAYKMYDSFIKGILPFEE